MTNRAGRPHTKVWIYTFVQFTALQKSGLITTEIGRPAGSYKQLPSGLEKVNVIGEGIVAEPRMYHLIRQQKPITDCRFEIELLESGIDAYSFTFG